MHTTPRIRIICMQFVTDFQIYRGEETVCCGRGKGGRVRGGTGRREAQQEDQGGHGLKAQGHHKEAGGDEVAAGQG